jgi:putative ABC transport system substrate-binding protein
VYNDPARLGPIDKALKDALAQSSIIDGSTVEFTYRYANGKAERLAALADELVAQKPDLLIGLGGDVVRPLFDASNGKIPVIGGVSDSPVRAGLAASLARPDKNFTGVSFLTDEMAGKRMEILKELVPSSRRVAVIFSPLHLDDELTFAKRAADALQIELSAHPINKVEHCEAALRDTGTVGADSLFIISSRLTSVVGAQIAQYGQQRHLPVIASWREFTADGALLSYGPNRIFEAKRLAGYVRKVLDGSKPADLPIEQPIKFELVINLKTARILDMQIGRDFMLRADDVIE